MSSAVIIVAAGKGNRFNSRAPKQFLKLGGKPVFLWSVIEFKKIKDFTQIILVVPRGYLKKLSSISKKYGIDLIEGGKERYDSVKAGLEILKRNIKYVAIHDAARPLIEKSMISKCLSTAKKYGSAIVAVPGKRYG